MSTVESAISLGRKYGLRVLAAAARTGVDARRGSRPDAHRYHDMGLIGSLLGTLYCGGRGYHASPLDFVRDPTRWLRDMTKWEAASSRGMAPSEGRPT